MYSRAHLDISAIETLLGDQWFLFGEVPTAADVSVGCTLASISTNLERTRLSAGVLDGERLMQYIIDVRCSVYPAVTSVEPHLAAAL
jgi:glutathione S-transferase